MKLFLLIQFRKATHTILKIQVLFKSEPALAELIHVYEPWQEISYNVVRATSKASDQPAHTRSLIRAFSSRLNIL